MSTRFDPPPWAWLIALGLAGAAGLAYAQEPPPGYRIRIGGAAPEVDPLAPVDEEEPDAETADGQQRDDPAMPDGLDPGEMPAPDGLEPAAEAVTPRSADLQPTDAPAAPMSPPLEKTGKKRKSRAKAAKKRPRRPKHARWTREPAVTPLEAARTLEQTPGVVIEFARPIAFRHDAVDLAPGAADALAEVVDYLQASPEIRLVLIEGHTDATGSLRYNQALSEARAVAVRTALITAGVSPDRLVAYGYGETRPAEPDQAANRRVVFRIIQGDRPTLTRREASEWGEAALVDGRGVVEIAPAPDVRNADTLPTANEMPAASPSAEDALPEPLPSGAEPAPAPPGAMALFIAPATTLEASAQPASAPTTVSEAVGSKSKTREQAAPGDWQTWPIRGQIDEGHDIRTGPASHALVRLPDLGRLWLGPETRVRLSKLHHDRADGKTYLALKLESGSLRAMLNPLERGISRSLIALPGGGLELIAADFELQVEADGIGRLRVDRGRVELTAGQRSRSVFAGQTTRLGMASAEPRAQLPPPTARTPLDGTFDRAPPLEWAPVQGAVGYRVEIAADVDFDRPVVRARTTAPRFAPRVLTPDRAWYWRVRAVDADGLTGSASRIHRFRTAPRVESPPAAAGLQPRNRSAP